MSRKHKRELRRQQQAAKSPPPADPPREPAKGGRKTILTPEVQAVIVEAAAKGTPLTFCGPLAGVSRTTLFNWLKWGQKPDTPYTAFVDAVKAAQARFVGERLTAIAKAEAWQSDAWLLERMFRDEFAGNQLEINQLKKELKELRQLLVKVPRDAGEDAAETGGPAEGGGDGPADGPAPPA